MATGGRFRSVHIYVFLEAPRQFNRQRSHRPSFLSGWELCQLNPIVFKASTDRVLFNDTIKGISRDYWFGNQ